MLTTDSNNQKQIFEDLRKWNNLNNKTTMKSFLKEEIEKKIMILRSQVTQNGFEDFYDEDLKTAFDKPFNIKLC